MLASVSSTFAEATSRADALESNLRTINQHFGKGVSPDENAVVLVYKAFGPHPETPGRRRLLSTIQIRSGSGRQTVRQGAEGLWTRKQCPHVLKWLEVNEKPVDVMIKATHRPKWYSPMIPPVGEDGRQQGIMMTLLPASQQIRSIARYFAARTHLAIAEKRFEDAWTDILNCHRLGRMQAKGPTVIDYLVGIAITSIASDLHVRFVRTAKPSVEKLLEMRDEYRELPEFPHPADQIEITERTMVLDLYSSLEHGDYEVFESAVNVSIDPADRVALSLVNWNLARAHGMEAYDELRELMKIKDPLPRSKRIAAWSEKLKANGTVSLDSIFNGFLKKGDVSGTVDTVVSDALVNTFLPAMGAVDTARTRAFVRLQNLETYFALELFREKNGQYPNSAG